MMKRFIQVLSLMVLATAIPASAQLNVFNHLGADISLGTTGIGIEVSSPITDYVDMRAGVSFIPGFSIHKDFNGTADVSTLTNPQRFTLQLDGSLARTQGNILFNVYPFGRVNDFFVTAGAYFGGKKLLSLKGHSDEVAQWQADGTLQTGYVEIGNYKVDFEEQGNVRGALCAKPFRPYLGVGYGRACPGKRLGFMVEAGVQFMGHMKVYQGKNMDPIDVSDLNKHDNWQKLMDNWTVYPVIRVSLTGKIF